MICRNSFQLILPSPSGSTSKIISANSPSLHIAKRHQDMIANHPRRQPDILKQRSMHTQQVNSSSVYSREHVFAKFPEVVVIQESAVIGIQAVPRGPQLVLAHVRILFHHQQQHHIRTRYPSTHSTTSHHRMPCICADPTKSCHQMRLPPQTCMRNKC